MSPFFFLYIIRYMIQVKRNALSQDVYWTSVFFLDKASVSIEFTNLMTNESSTYLVQARAVGDWYKARIPIQVALPVGMYIVKVIFITDVVARRLAYLAYNRTEAIQTDIEEYETNNTNVVYEG